MSDLIILEGNRRCPGKCGDGQICSPELFHNGYCLKPWDRDVAITRALLAPGTELDDPVVKEFFKD